MNISQQVAFVFIVIFLDAVTVSLRTTRIQPAIVAFRKLGRVGGQHFDDNGIDEGFKIMINRREAPPPTISSHTIFPHLGDEFARHDAFIDDYEERKKRQNFNANVGKALEVLRRELPMVFAVSNLDFTIFAHSITVVDGNGHSMLMPLNFYMTAVKSLRVAATLSAMYPSINVRKIEYLEDCRTIQCLVDVVLPDSVRIDGQAVWQGMFYFGLDSDGFVDSHTFDRKISNFRPQNKISVGSGQMPWLRGNSAGWTADLLGGGAVSRPNGGLVAACEESKANAENGEWKERLQEN